MPGTFTGNHPTLYHSHTLRCNCGLIIYKVFLGQTALAGLRWLAYLDGRLV